MFNCWCEDSYQVSQDMDTTYIVVINRTDKTIPLRAESHVNYMDETGQIKDKIIYFNEKPIKPNSTESYLTGVFHDERVKTLVKLFSTDTKKYRFLNISWFGRANQVKPINIQVVGNRFMFTDPAMPEPEVTQVVFGQKHPR